MLQNAKQLLFKETFSKDPFFNIDTIEKEPSATNMPRKFEPHSHDYYVIMVVEDGFGKHFIDFNTYEIVPKCLFFISPNQVHQVLETSTHKGFVISFNEGFLLKSNISRQFFQNINIFKGFGDTPPLLASEGIFKKLKELCSQMQTCFVQDSAFKHEALGALLKLFLIECNSACELNQTPPELTLDNAIITITRFKELVEKHFKTHHKASQYAQMLHITTNYLNKLVKTYLHFSTKEYIQNRLVLEAKRMLLNPEVSAKEIAYQLGFNEPAHFSNAFKNCTGLSTSEFKEKFQN